MTDAGIALQGRGAGVGTGRKRLIARTVRVSSLDAATRESAFELFRQSYAEADRARFDSDLAEKQLVILLDDRAEGGLKGFSTVHIQRRGLGTVIFSGDTVIDRAYWGQKQLQLAFLRLLLTVKLRSPHRPLYWFLISKGWRTYLLLANGFGRSVPRCDRGDDVVLRATLDTLATERFGSQYDSTTSVIRYARQHERVREDLAPVPAALQENPHVRFFAERNPGHLNGDELACLADVRFVDLARIGRRLAATLTRRAFTRRSRP
ncbi:hypothetical protein BH23GEM1_BH23GEM1_05750 [soil metagenome]